jgi:tetratricopeptide (TPR) repeat protein
LKKRKQIGGLLLQDNDARGAEGHFRQAIELDTQIAEYHRGLAEAPDRQARRSDAISHLRTFVVRNPGDAVARAFLADLAHRVSD